MKFKLVTLGILTILFTSCATKTPLSFSSDSLKIYRANEVNTQTLQQLKSLGDLESSSTEFSEKVAAEETLRNIKKDAESMGATSLLINKAETKYNPFTAKYTVLINATALK